MGHILRLLLSTLILIGIASTGAASVEVIDLYSDQETADITLRADEEKDVTVTLTVRHGGDEVESKVLEARVGPIPTTLVVVWSFEPVEGNYNVNATVVDEDKIVTKGTSFRYGGIAFPRFQIQDLFADSSRAQLVLTNFKTDVVDVEIQLVDNNTVVYSKVTDGLALLQPVQHTIQWPVLLEKNKEYIARAKVTSRAQDTTVSQATSFTARPDVELSDIEVDEFGGSATITGASQVPFEGKVAFQVDGKSFSDESEILTTGEEDTVGVIWNGEISPGMHKVIITAEEDGEILDQREVMLRVPPAPVATATPTPESPGVTAVMTVVGVMAALFIRRCR